MSDQEEQAIECECGSVCEAETKPKAGKGKGKRVRKPKAPKASPEPEVEAEQPQEPDAEPAVPPEEEPKPPAVKKARKRGAGAKAKAVKAHADALVAKALAEQTVGDVNVTCVYIEETTPGAGAGQTQYKTVQRVQKKRKQLDVAQTQANYRARMLAERTPADWASLKGAWLSDYKLYTNEPKVDHSAHHGHIILELAKAKGIDVKGLCAENVKKCDVTATDGTVTRERKFVQDPLPDGTARAASTIVYIGNQNLFTEHAQSIWSCKPDEVWVTPE
jgi:hypothetical protein